MPSTDEMYMTQDRSQIEVSTMPGAWMQIDGQEGERDVTVQSPGVGAADVQLVGKSKPGNITLVKMFNVSTDLAVLKRLEAENRFRDTTVTVTFVDEDDNAIPGATLTYPGCVVASWALSGADRNGSDPQTLTVVWARKRAI